jgi:S-adenosylmethionine hydrolase
VFIKGEFMRKSCIVLISDHGYSSTKTAAMIGAIKKVDADIDVYPINSAVRKGCVSKASALLYSNIPYWPEGTVFVSEVGNDGCHRACAVVLENGSMIVTPDNGTLTMPDREFGIKAVYEIDPSRFDSEGGLLAKCAANLAGGLMTVSETGTEYPASEIVRLGLPRSLVTSGRAEGEITMVLENFGNLTFSIGIEEFEKTGIRYGDLTHVGLFCGNKAVFSENVEYHRSFGYVKEGDPILFNGSSGYMDLALNRESFVNKYVPEILGEDASYSDYKVVIEKVL